MARSKGRTGRPWRRVRQQILAASDVCWLCGKSGATTVDHVIPVSHGGPLRDPANLRPAHLSCNTARGNRMRRPRQPMSREW